MTPLNKAKLQWVIERALTSRQKREKEAGLLHNVKECQQRHLRQIHAVKGRLTELPRVLANTLVGQPAAEIERIITEQVTAILEDFAADGS